jgi:hypothetical protein
LRKNWLSFLLLIFILSLQYWLIFLSFVRFFRIIIFIFIVFLMIDDHFIFNSCMKLIKLVKFLRLNWVDIFVRRSRRRIRVFLLIYFPKFSYIIKGWLLLFLFPLDFDILRTIFWNKDKSCGVICWFVYVLIVFYIFFPVTLNSNS